MLPFLHTVSARIRRPRPTCPQLSAEFSAATDLAALYDTCSGPVYQYLFYRTLRHAAAESLTEQVFRRAFALVRDGVLDTDAPLPWLFRLAETVHAEQQRHTPNAASAPQAAHASAPTATPVDGETAANLLTAANENLVTRAVACISPEELQVVVLRFGQRLGRMESACRLQIAPEDVARLEVQALRTVSECLHILRDLQRIHAQNPVQDVAPHKDLPHRLA